MINYTTKKCLGCNEDYTPVGPAARYCSVCAKIKTKESILRRTLKYRIKKGCKIGGTGCNNSKGLEDSQFKTGISFFHKNRKKIKTERRYCERCNKDLIDSSRYEWCLHHKDHDRKNNNVENFELLCKRCHQLEHKCWKNFIIEGATTISKESREQSSRSA
jgi:hypothetical protein